MEAVAFGHLPDRQFLLKHNLLRAEAHCIELDHEQEREVVEAGRDGRHPDDVEIADLQELGDQERCGTEHGRRYDGAETACGEQATGSVFFEPGLFQHRPRHRADHHGRRNAGTRRSAQQKRRGHDRTAGARGLAAHDRQREIDKEFSRTRMLKDGSVDREHDDQCGRHVDRDAKYSFERNEQMPNQARNIETTVGPWRRQMRAEHRVGNEQNRDHRHDRPRGASCCFEHENDKDGAEDDIPAIGHRRTIQEIVSAPERIDNDTDASERRNHVEPLHMIPEPRGERKQHEAEREHESNVDIAQLLRGYDVVGGIKVEHRHRDRDRGHGCSNPAREPVGSAFFLLNVFFGFAELFFGNNLRFRARFYFFDHRPLTPAAVCPAFRKRG